MEAQNVQITVKPKYFGKNEMGMLNLITPLPPNEKIKYFLASMYFEMIPYYITGCLRK